MAREFQFILFFDLQMRLRAKAYTGCPPVSRGGRRGFTIADAVNRSNRDVRFSPDSGHPTAVTECPLRAMSGLMHRNKFGEIQRGNSAVSAFHFSQPA
jgi:hypothetical protein